MYAYVLDKVDRYAYNISLSFYIFRYLTLNSKNKNKIDKDGKIIDG